MPEQQGRQQSCSGILLQESRDSYADGGWDRTNPADCIILPPSVTMTTEGEADVCLTSPPSLENLRAQLESDSTNGKRIHNTEQLDKSAESLTSAIVGSFDLSCPVINRSRSKEEGQGFIQESQNLGTWKTYHEALALYNRKPGKNSAPISIVWRVVQGFRSWETYGARNSFAMESGAPCRNLRRMGNAGEPYRVLIDDSECSSIACDICDKWFHSQRECSKLKKTLFNNIRKDLLIENHKKELLVLSNQNSFLIEENKSLKSALILKEREIDELRVSFANKKLKDEQGWQRVVNGGRVLTSETGDQALRTSNYFETLSATEVDGLQMVEFPPLGNKRNGAQRASQHKKGGSGRKKKIHLVGDSHGRRCYGRIKSKMDAEVRASVFPGKPLSFLIEHAGEAEEVSPADLLVVVGGTNQVSEDSISGLTQKFDSLAGIRKEDVLWVETPFRFDDVSKNPLIKEQNEKIKHECTKRKWAYLSLNSMLD
ncbi:hypothetical protein J6590_100484 [Homalodisca vitripennis]|nr:hypothetical protein J6590_100484 [Homalodisca vitripennis]